MKKMLVLTLALSLFAAGSAFANDANNDLARGPKKVNVSLLLPTPPPPPVHNCCCNHHKPAPPKHNCHKPNDKHHGKCDHRFNGPRPKPGHNAPVVRPNGGNNHRPVDAPRPGNGHKNYPSKGGNRR